jgi:MFS family permease
VRYWLVAAIMIAGALGSALSGSFWVLIGFRFVLGVGVGGDYPVSAVMVSEYANRKDRGKLVGMVFGTQALGLVVGPLDRAGPARLGRQRRRGLGESCSRSARGPPPP